MINPILMTVQEWTDKTTPILEKYGAIPRLDNPDNWQEWAARVISLSKLQGSSPPNPFQFQDWKDWAQRFNEAVQIEG